MLIENMNILILDIPIDDCGTIVDTYCKKNITQSKFVISIEIF